MREAGLDLTSNDGLVEDIVADKLMLDLLYMALDKLTDDERKIINGLFFQGKSDRELAAEEGVSHVAISKRKNRIVKKLKKIMHEG